MADQARRLLPLRLGPTRLLDGLLLLKTNLKVHDQANTKYAQSEIPNTQLLDRILLAEVNLKFAAQAD